MPFTDKEVCPPPSPPHPTRQEVLDYVKAQGTARAPWLTVQDVVSKFTTADHFAHITVLLFAQWLKADTSFVEDQKRAHTEAKDAVCIQVKRHLEALSEEGKIRGAMYEGQPVYRALAVQGPRGPREHTND